MQSVCRKHQFVNCFTTSMKTGNLLSGDIKKNLIKGRSLQSAGSLVKKSFCTTVPKYEP